MRYYHILMLAFAILWLPSCSSSNGSDGDEPDNPVTPETPTQTREDITPYLTYDEALVSASADNLVAWLKEIKEGSYYASLEGFEECWKIAGGFSDEILSYKGASVPFVECNYLHLRCKSNPTVFESYFPKEASINGQSYYFLLEIPDLPQSSLNQLSGGFYKIKGIMEDFKDNDTGEKGYLGTIVYSSGATFTEVQPYGNPNEVPSITYSVSLSSKVDYDNLAQRTTDFFDYLVGPTDGLSDKQKIQKLCANYDKYLTKHSGYPVPFVSDNYWAKQWSSSADGITNFTHPNYEVEYCGYSVTMDFFIWNMHDDYSSILESSPYFKVNGKLRQAGQSTYSEADYTVTLGRFAYECDTQLSPIGY